VKYVEELCRSCGATRRRNSSTYFTAENAEGAEMKVSDLTRSASAISAVSAVMM
jgi:hypothetical protein